MCCSKFSLSHQIQDTLISLLTYYKVIVDSAQGHTCLVPWPSYPTALVFGIDFDIYCFLRFLDLCLHFFAFPVSHLGLSTRCAYKTDVLHCSYPYRIVPNTQPNPILFLSLMSSFRHLREIENWAEDKKGKTYSATHLLLHTHVPLILIKFIFLFFWLFQEQGTFQKDILERHLLSS